MGFANQEIAAIDEEIFLRETQQGTSITSLEVELESLAWKEAASKKCDYVKDVPLGLVEKVRSLKGGFKGQNHHFTAYATNQTLFRFKRSSKS